MAQKPSPAANRRLDRHHPIQTPSLAQIVNQHIIPQCGENAFARSAPSNVGSVQSPASSLPRVRLRHLKIETELDQQVLVGSAFRRHWQGVCALQGLKRRSIKRLGSGALHDLAAQDMAVTIELAAELDDAGCAKSMRWIALDRLDPPLQRHAPSLHCPCAWPGNEARGAALPAATP
jgi:hypothetical protein